LFDKNKQAGSDQDEDVLFIGSNEPCAVIAGQQQAGETGEPFGQGTACGCVL
jgi:hypothetical protein